MHIENGAAGYAAALRMMVQNLVAVRAPIDEVQCTAPQNFSAQFFSFRLYRAESTAVPQGCEHARMSR